MITIRIWQEGNLHHGRATDGTHTFEVVAPMGQFWALLGDFPANGNFEGIDFSGHHNEAIGRELKELDAQGKLK